MTDHIRSDFPTNLSRSITFSVFDQDEREITIRANPSSPIEILIPRDPNLRLSPMSLQNVTSLNGTRLFNLHFVQLGFDYTMSLHFQMRPLNSSLAYLLIYAFERAPQVNRSFSDIDGWTLFCPSSKCHSIEPTHPLIRLLDTSTDYTFFIEQQQTSNRQSVIFGLRELTVKESLDHCSNRSMNQTLPIPEQPSHFTADYQLRLYTSGCYYLDANQQWRSDGLQVTG